MADFEIRELRPGDETSLLETFNLVFGADDPGFQVRTRAQWSWAFEQNPAGQRVFVALAPAAGPDRSQQVVAQYAALPTRIWSDGAEHRFAQIVDSFVHPDHRGGGRLFVRTARAFFEAYGGPQRDLVHFGWPVERALKIGRRALGYEVVRTQLFLVRGLAPGATSAPSGVECIDSPEQLGEHFGQQLQWLFERCVGEFGASTLRDAAWFRWRFHDRPGNTYRTLGVRDAEGILRGLCVLGRGAGQLTGAGLLVDWLVPPAELEVADLLLAGVTAELASQAATEAVVLFPEWSPWFAHFQERGFLAHPSAYCAVARAFHPRFDSTWLRDQWWYQLSDTDLC